MPNKADLATSTFMPNSYLTFRVPLSSLVDCIGYRMQHQHAYMAKSLDGLTIRQVASFRFHSFSSIRLGG